MERVKITPPQVQGFEPVTVTATLATAERSLHGVHVVFSDGDPQQGGAAFDAELIPHIRANDLYVTQVKFHPRTCGTHTVFVVAGGGTAASATDTATVDVTLDLVAAVDGLRTTTASLELPPPIAQRLVAKLKVAKQAFEHNFALVAVNRLTGLFGPLGLKNTELPASTVNTIPEPYSHGYLYGSSSVALVGTPPYSPEFQAAARAGTLAAQRLHGPEPFDCHSGRGRGFDRHGSRRLGSRRWSAGRVLGAEYQRRWLQSVRLEDPNKPEGQKYGYGIAQHAAGDRTRSIFTAARRPATIRSSATTRRTR